MRRGGSGGTERDGLGGRAGDLRFSQMVELLPKLSGWVCFFAPTPSDPSRSLLGERAVGEAVAAAALSAKQTRMLQQAMSKQKKRLPWGDHHPWLNLARCQDRRHDTFGSTVEAVIPLLELIGKSTVLIALFSSPARPRPSPRPKPTPVEVGSMSTLPFLIAQLESWFGKCVRSENVKLGLRALTWCRRRPGCKKRCKR